MAIIMGPRPTKLRAFKWEDLSLECGTPLMRRTVVESKGQPPKIRNSTEKTGRGRSYPTSWRH